MWCRLANTVTTDSAASALLDEADRLLASDPARALELAQQARLLGEGSPAETSASLTARAACQVGVCLFWTGCYADAIAQLEAAERLAAAATDDRVIGRAVNTLGVVYMRLGDAATALDYLDRALALRQRSGDRAGEASTLHNLGIQRRELGDLDGARACYEAARAIDRSLGDLAGEGRTAMSLGVVMHKQGRHADAEQAYREAIAISGRAGDSISVLRGHENLASLYVDQRRLEEAAVVVEQALLLDRELSHRELRADILGTKGRVLRLAGRHVEAIAVLREAAAEPLAGARRQFLAELYREIADACEAVGDHAAALTALKTSYESWQAVYNEETQQRLKAVAIHREIQIARQDAAEARREADEDALTGVRSRRYLDRWLGDFVRQTEDSGIKPALVLLDIDHFKRINDGYGHAAGDTVLRELGRRLRESCRTTDLVARYGGEEFCVAFAAANLDEAVAQANRVRLALLVTPVTLASGPLSVTASAGVTVLGDGESVATALQRADAALYRAKAAGRNRTESL